MNYYSKVMVLKIFIVRINVAEKQKETLDKLRHGLLQQLFI